MSASYISLNVVTISPGSHALCVQEQDFVIHRGESALVLFDQLGLEAAGPVEGSI